MNSCSKAVFLFLCSSWLPGLAADTDCTKAAKNVICLDRKQMIAPLETKFAPNEEVKIVVKRKSPFEKITFKAEFSQVESPNSFEKLFQAISTLLLGVPLVEKSTMGAEIFDARIESIPPGARSSLTEDLKTLRTLQQTLQHDLKSVVAEYRAEGKEQADFRSCKNACASSDTFRANLEKRIAAAKGLAEKLLPTLFAAELLVDRIEFYVRSGRSVTTAELQLIDDLLANQKALRKLVETAEKAQLAFKNVQELLTDIEADSAHWFEQSETFAAPKNHKATIEISAYPLDGSEKDAVKLTTVPLLWQAAPRYSVSLGIAVSSVAKDEYFNETVRDPNVPSLVPADTSKALSYRINRHRTRPVVFPVSLIHVHIPYQRLRWFSLAAGGGVNPAGDTATGELLFGGSIQWGKFFISPLLHLGRQQRLGDNFKLLEATPADFTPPSSPHWKPGVAVAITYRLPI